MISRTLVLVTLVYRVHSASYQPEAPPPLPTPDPEVQKNFRLALEAIFGIGVKLQSFMQEGQENFLVSPVSATLIIGQLLLGSDGVFRKELADVLALSNSHFYENELVYYYNANNRRNTSHHLPYATVHLQLTNLLKTLESANDASKHFTLHEKSALFYDSRLTLNKTFERGMRRWYEAQLYPSDFTFNPFETQRQINAWVNENTNGLIKSILSSPPLPTTSSIFTNAIYFKAEWETPFSDMLNRKGLFNVTTTKRVPVTYMINQFDQILYSDSSEYRMIALPYTNEELGMYILYPRSNSTYKYNMKQFLRFLSFKEVLSTVQRARRRDVVVKIPKMSLSSKFSILDQLKKYRSFRRSHLDAYASNSLDKVEQRVDAFSDFRNTDNSDVYLNTATLEEALKVGDIVQEVVIKVNEKGTEAAAVAAATIDYMGGVVNFIVERPFVFFIRHEATSVSLFWGTVSNPAAKD